MHPKAAGKVPDNRWPAAIGGDDLVPIAGKEGSAADHPHVHLLVFPVLAPFPDVAPHVIESKGIGRITAHGSGVRKSVATPSASRDLVGIIAGVRRGRPLGPPRTNL